jgi:DNA-binding CsgD family transcriptional regulator
MVPDQQFLSELIGGLYDTTLDGAMWPGLLRRLADFIGGCAASIYSKSAITGSGDVYHQVGTDPRYEQMYFSKHIRVDPTTTGHLLADVGQMVSLRDIMPWGEFVESRFHREWSRPQDLVDCLSTPLDKATGSAALFGVFRHRDNGVVDDEMRQRASLVIPHVRRAVLIGNMLETKAAGTTAFIEALNGLSAAVFLVDKYSRIVFANISGLAMLDDGRILSVSNDVLTAVDLGAELSEAVASAAGGDAALGMRGVAVPLRAAQQQPPWVAHVLPLTSGARQQTGESFAAMAAVFVHKTSIEARSSMESIAKLYRLTPGEMRVLSAVSDVGGVAEVADAIGISKATVKTHLQHLFGKTGTNRQTELVRLVATHASPLRQQ